MVLYCPSVGTAWSWSINTNSMTEEHANLCAIIYLMITVFKNPEDATGLICLGTPLCSQIQYSHIFVLGFYLIYCNYVFIKPQPRPWPKWSMWSRYSTFKINWCGFSKVLLKSVLDCLCSWRCLPIYWPIRGLYLPVWPIRGLYLPVWPIRSWHHMPQVAQ